MAERYRGIRVLMTADTLGGVWDYSLELAADLARRGIRTVLATMGRLPDARQKKDALGVPGLILEESEYRLEWMPEAGADPERAGAWLLQLEKRHAPDVIHLNGYFHADLPWRAPCLVVAHSCVLTWWQAVKGAPAPPEWSRYATRVGKGLHQADRVVAPTGALLEAMERTYGRLNRSVVIRNGRRPDRFRPAPKGEFVFCAGRLWDEAKNLAALAAIADDLDWRVVAAGDWRRPEGGGGKPPHIHCLGHLAAAEMAAWMGRAPIYALPARYEPFGLSVLEAALSGCALVLGDIPTLRELWDGAALFVPPDDPRRLRAALQGLIRDADLRQAFGEAARQRGARYDSNAMGEAYTRLYGRLLGRGSTAAEAVVDRTLFPAAAKS